MSDHDAQPAPSEPVTPMWLPALGALLFLAVGIWWATQPKAPSDTNGVDGGTAAAEAPSGTPPPTLPVGQAPPQTPPPRGAPPGMPAGHGAPPGMPAGHGAPPPTMPAGHAGHGH